MKKMITAALLTIASAIQGNQKNVVTIYFEIIKNL